MSEKLRESKPWGRATQLPGAAHIEDFRPGAIIEDYHDGRLLATLKVTSYPYTVAEPGVEGTWVDVERTYASAPDRHYKGTSSLADGGVVPYENSGNLNGLYNSINVDKLAKPAPVKDRSVPRSLRRILERPYASLTDKEKAQATRYFLGQQALSFLERKNQGVEEPLLQHSSVKV